MTRVRETRGLRMLARLAAAPGERIHALALESDDLDGENKPGESDAGPALDPTALRQYRTRLAELDADLAEAESDADMGRVANIRRERDFLIAEITRAVGLGGRLRKVGSATERARVNVTRRIKDAVARVADGDAEIGRHLEAAIRTGTYCTYRP